MRRLAALGLLAAVGLAPFVQARTVLAQTASDYRQSPAVLARYGDVPLTLGTPGVAPGRTAPTTQVEMLDFLDGLKARHPGLVLASLGRSLQGRDLPYLLFTAEGLADPAAVRALQRPIVWIVGQQHGNEPAGGEGALALAKALAEGDLKLLLSRITVVVVPRANPDGAAAGTRTGANGLDPNRDHLLLTLPEIRALHAGMVALPPDLVLDAHEYQVAGTWLARFGALQKSDAMLLAATHPAVPKAVAAFAEDEILPAIEAAFRPHGLTAIPYHTATGRTDDRSVALGGNAPGISRNNFGLGGAVSLLVETRGIGIGLEGFQRRVATHYLAGKAVLEQVATDPERLRALVAATRRALAAEGGPLIVGYAIESVPFTLPLVEPQTGADQPIPVTLHDSRRVRVTQTRPRPAGYLLQPEAAAAIEALRIRGAILCPLRPGAALAVEAFRVEARAAPVNRESINPEQAVAVPLAPRTLVPGDGAVYVPMGQALSAIAAAALEPDSPGSHVGTGVTPVGADGEAPVYRILAPPPPMPGAPAGCG